MKELVFIIPYFGKFNNYFQFFLESCKKNKNVDWIIFTDDKTKYNYPPNVKVIYMSFSEIKEVIQSKIPFKISLERPYKLCDLRPFYGEIFRKYVEQYYYWGYCDTDIIWGNIEKMIFKILKEQKYDKLFFLGHCSIFRNNKSNNKFLKKILYKEQRVKDVLQNKDNCSFDEEFKKSINTFYIDEGKLILLKELEANIYMKATFFKLVLYDFLSKRYKVEKRKKFLMVYDNGNLKRYYMEEGKLKQEEFLYIHMQSRKMKFEKYNNINLEYYKIIPNSFENIEYSEITKKNFQYIVKERLNFHYFELRGKNLYNKILKKWRKLWKIYIF